MLVDIKKLETVKDSRESGLDYHPSDYAQDDEVFVYRIDWFDGEFVTEGDIVSYNDAVKFVAEFDDEWLDRYAKFSDMPKDKQEAYYKDAHAILDKHPTIRIGPDEDRYHFFPLPQPMTHDESGELVALEDLGNDEARLTAEDLGVRPGVDYPGSLRRTA